MFDQSMKFHFKTVVLVAILAVMAQAQSSADPVKEAQRLTRVAQVAEQQSRYDDAIKAYQTITVVASACLNPAASAAGFVASTQWPRRLAVWMSGTCSQPAPMIRRRLAFMRCPTAAVYAREERRAAPKIVIEA